MPPPPLPLSFDAFADAAMPSCCHVDDAAFCHLFLPMLYAFIELPSLRVTLAAHTTLDYFSLMSLRYAADVFAALSRRRCLSDAERDATLRFAMMP